MQDLKNTHHQLLDYFKDQLLANKSIKNKDDQEVVLFLSQKKSRLTPLDLGAIEHTNAVERLFLWRRFFQRVLLVYLSHGYSLYLEKKNLRKIWQTLASLITYEHSRLERGYAELTAILLGIHSLESFEIDQYDNGMIPLMDASYHKLLNIPFIEWQAEFATLLILIGKLKNKPFLTKQGCKVASWLMQHLQQDGMPYKSLLASQKYSCYFSTILRLSILFYSASFAVVKGEEFAFLAQKYFEYLKADINKHSIESSLDAVLLLNWFKQLYPGSTALSEPKITETLEDPSFALASIRRPDLTVLATLAGTNTAMGSLKCQDIEIVAFGPQVGDLDNEELFGIIGEAAESETIRLDVDDRGRFSLKGVVGIPSNQEGMNLLESWQYPVGWLDAKMTFENDTFKVSIKPLNIHHPFYFVFYVSASQCLIKGEKKILYQSLEQFQGYATDVSFLSKSKIINLKLQQEDTLMKIIPLEGGASFWGANYLIAYQVSKKGHNYDWQMTVGNR